MKILYRAFIRIRKPLAALAPLAMIAFITLACGATATPIAPLSQSDVATIVAATIQALTAQAPTSIPPTAIPPTATPLSTAVPTFPPVQPTQILPASTRINFLLGTTTGSVTGTIQAGETKTYVLEASQGQPMIVMTNSFNNDVTMSIKTKGGTSILSAASKLSNWQGTLPTTEDYYISIYGGATAENFTLSVEIPARIKFAANADSANVSGKTVGGDNVAYTVFASQGQNMKVDLNGVGSNAALTIYGFSDGQPYIRSVTGATTFNFKLPLTQDYIIEVVPMAGQVVNYTLVINIK